MWIFLPLVFISDSMWSETARAGCSGMPWTWGWALVRRRHEETSASLHPKQARDFIRAVMNAPWITHCHQRANAWRLWTSLTVFYVRFSVCISVVRVSKNAFLRDVHAFGLLSLVRENEVRSLTRSLFVIFPALFALTEVGVFRSVTFVHLSVSDRPVLNRTVAVERQAGCGSDARAAVT